MNKIEENFGALRGVGSAGTNYRQKSAAALFSDVSAALKTQTAADKTAAMTMEEYKIYLHNEISELSVDPSQKDVFYFIDITEEGFEAMKNSPAYENEVLGMIEDYFKRRVPGGYMGCTSFRIGASMDDIFVQSYSTQDPFAGKKDGKSFWERRAEREKEINERNEKYLEKKRQKEAYISKRIQERHFVERKNFEELSRVAAVKARDPEKSDEEKNLLTEKVISSYQNFLA